MLFLPLDLAGMVVGLGEECCQGPEGGRGGERPPVRLPAAGLVGGRCRSFRVRVAGVGWLHGLQL